MWSVCVCVCVCVCVRMGGMCVYDVVCLWSDAWSVCGVYDVR